MKCFAFHIHINMEHAAKEVLPLVIKSYSGIEYGPLPRAPGPEQSYIRAIGSGGSEGLYRPLKKFDISNR
jgi:hypothetical protein